MVHAHGLSGARRGRGAQARAGRRARCGRSGSCPEPAPTRSRRRSPTVTARSQPCSSAGARFSGSRRAGACSSKVSSPKTARTGDVQPGVPTGVMPASRRDHAPSSSEILTRSAVNLAALLVLSPHAISKLFGLPAHPLFVHVPVVLIPLVGIGAIAMAFSARVRDRYGWLVLVDCDRRRDQHTTRDRQRPGAASTAFPLGGADAATRTSRRAFAR